MPTGSYSVLFKNKIKKFRKVTSVDPDKSVSIRSFLIGSIGHGISEISNVLESEDMSGTEKLMPSELSGGMKKRIGIARAIALEPKYLLYDEPTTGLDPISIENINTLIKKIHNRGDITSIMVTHELKTVYDVADRVVMLDQKKVIFDNKPSELINSKERIVHEFIGNSELIKEKYE